MPSLLHVEVPCPLLFTSPTASGALLSVDMAPAHCLLKVRANATMFLPVECFADLDRTGGGTELEDSRRGSMFKWLLMHLLQQWSQFALGPEIEQVTMMMLQQETSICANRIDHRLLAACSRIAAGQTILKVRCHVHCKDSLQALVH